MKPLDFTPAIPWKFVVGDQVAGVVVTPRRLTAAICGGRLEPYTIQVMMATVETAKILNRITDKHEHHGVPS